VRDCESACCGAKQFFCGCKHKFGLNLQGTCDARGKFLDISICHPASTTNFLAFSTLRFHKRIETPGFLSPGLCIFGDSAYVNNGYVVTPFKNVKSGMKDFFNFFQSQLQISIECCFGMLVGRWGIPRRAFPQAMTRRNLTGVVNCLCRLHNVYIDNQGDKLMAPALPSDDADSNAHKGAGEELTVNDLLHGGDHHDNTSRILRQELARSGLPMLLPRDRLITLVEEGGFTCPLPKS
jgi:DDE superfamily endonuclease